MILVAKMMWRKTANSREEMPEYVERSYHEALVNGLGHRDYLIYGSGFGKIISGYEFKKNYTDNKKPTFRSDRYQFTVIMPNLNYVPKDVPQDHLDVQILELMRANDKISTESIAKTLGVSSKTIKRRIKEMDNVRYIGSGYSGNSSVKVGLFRILKINLPCGRISLTDLKLYLFILRSAKKRHKRITYLQGGM